MGSNRRAFLQFAGLAPAAAATAALAESSAPNAVTDIASLTRSRFLPCVGDEFLFETRPLEHKRVKLAKVEALGQGDPHEGRFRLLFEAAGGGLVQETYTVSHPALGRFALFVSPNDAQGRVIEAIFNRV